MTVTQHHLDIDGGTLYYETRGHGPLLLVVGQPMTSEPFGPVADRLADAFTVVTYDPHGVGASTVEDLTTPITPEVEADDLARIIDEFGGGPAEVFGSSGGAVAGLALVTAYPDKVRTLIAHEPPVTELLPDAAHVRATVDDIAETYRESGSGSAWGRFVSLVMHQGAVGEAGPDRAEWPPPGMEPVADEPSPPPTAKQQSDDELFFLRMLTPFTRYRPDVAALTAAPTRVVVAIGADSGPEVARRSAEALAAQLGVEPVVFPGDHGGFMADPDGFAAAIRTTLG